MTGVLEHALHRVERLVSLPLIATVAVMVAWLSVSSWLGWSSWRAHQRLTALRARAQETDVLIAQHDAYETAWQQQTRAVDDDPRLNPTQSLAEALTMLSSLATRDHVSLVVQQPPTTRAELRWQLAHTRTFRDVPLTLELTGRYRNIAEFLGALSEMPLLNAVRHITLDPKDALTATGGLRATVEVSVFVPQPTESNGSHTTDAAPSDLLASLPASSTHDVATQQKAARQTTWRRDPFTQGAAGGNHALSLNGILWNDQQPMAIINDQTVRVGESIEGYTVVEIGKDFVSVTDGTQTIQLRIAP